MCASHYNFAMRLNRRSLLRVGTLGLRTALERGALLALTSATLASGAQFQLLSPADRTLAHYFETETAALESQCLADTNSVNNFKTNRDQFRQQLQEMLGLDPMPPRSDLKPVITGTVERDSFLVEKLHFQALPGFYVTANLYRPKEQQGPASTILCVSGHGPLVSHRISYGNKVASQHH